MWNATSTSNVELRRIFDCFSSRFDKVVFNLKLSNLVDSDVPSSHLESDILCATAHFPFQFKPKHSKSTLTDLRTPSSLLPDAANTFKSSMYNRCVVFRLIHFDNLYPSVALRFQAIAFRHKVKSLGQNASPCGNALLKVIISNVFIPRFGLWWYH